MPRLEEQADWYEDEVYTLDDVNDELHAEFEVHTAFMELTTRIGMLVNLYVFIWEWLN